MKYIIETDHEDVADEIGCMVDLMTELDSDDIEKDPEKLADEFIDWLFDCDDVFEIVQPCKHDELNQPITTKAITIEDLKTHLVILYNKHLAELFQRRKMK